MAQRTQGYRTMGTRTVSVTFTFSVDGNRNITDRRWDEIERALEEAAEDVVNRSLLAYPVAVETIYNRQVEVREPYFLD